MIIVDTNMLVYIWVRGDRTPAAEAVLGKDPVWAAPSLWRSEFRSTLLSFIRRGATALDAALHIVARAERMMAGHEYTVVSHGVLGLAERSRCSAYDCEFVAVAQDLAVPLVTVDEEVLRAFPTVAVRPETFVAS